MSYLVLARKYRPQRFSELVGQEHVARTLTNAIEQNRVHHAFLFTGARGVGKTSAARILAKALSCAEGPTANPCGKCEACEEIAGGRSVDVMEIDGASNTGVDDVRTLREGVRYQPAKGRRKIYILDEVHMLSTSAFNALLKTLEEPPPHVVFIFATTEAHKIPATILSRCQRYDFKLIPTSRLVSHLEGILRTENIGFEPEGLRLLARQAAGSVRDGLSLLDQVIAYLGAGGDGAPSPTLGRDVVSEVLGVADRSLLTEIARAVLGRDAATTLRRLAAAAERGLDLGQLARAFLSLLRDIEVVARVPDPEDLVDATTDELGEMRGLAEAAVRPGGGDLLAVLFDRWARAVDESAKSPAPRLILEMAAVDLCSAEPLEPLGDLLERLESMESRLEGGGSAPWRGPAPPAPPSSPQGSDRSGRREQRSGGEPGGPATATRAAPQGAATVEPRPDPPAAGASASTQAPPPAPATATAATAAAPTLVAAWARVRADFERTKYLLAAVLANAHVLALDGGKLSLGFADRSDVDAAEKARGEIEQALSAHLGSPVRLAITSHASGPGGSGASPVIRAQVAEDADAVAGDRRRREQEARQHPIVQKAQDLFGAAIREIKT
jgi:DNA polymerase III subunit gamma/tau